MTLYGRTRSDVELAEWAAIDRSASGRSRLTSTLNRRWSRHHVNGRFRGPTAIRESAAAGTLSAIADVRLSAVVRWH
jgi:hypothetical protein